MPNLHLTLDEKWRICSILTRSDAGEQSRTHIHQEGHHNPTQTPGSPRKRAYLLHVPVPTCIQKFIYLIGVIQSNNTAHRAGSQKPRAEVAEMAHGLKVFGAFKWCQPSAKWDPVPSSGLLGNCTHVGHKIRIISLKRKVHQLRVQS